MRAMRWRWWVARSRRRDYRGSNSLRPASGSASRAVEWPHSPQGTESPRSTPTVAALAPVERPTDPRASRSQGLPATTPGGVALTQCKSEKRTKPSRCPEGTTTQACSASGRPGPRHREVGPSVGSAMAPPLGTSESCRSLPRDVTARPLLPGRARSALASPLSPRSPAVSLHDGADARSRDDQEPTRTHSAATPSETSWHLDDSAHADRGPLRRGCPERGVLNRPCAGDAPSMPSRGGDRSRRRAAGRGATRFSPAGRPRSGSPGAGVAPPR